MKEPSALASPQKLLDMCSFLRGTKIPGCVVEVGVFQGGSLYQLSLTGRQCYGYDTFEGIPDNVTAIDYVRKGWFATPFETVQAALAKQKNITLIKGLYPDSDTIKPSPIVLAHVDVDTYASTRAALQHLWPLLAPGGRLYDDDAFQETCYGATLALCEFCAEHQVVPHCSREAYYVEKPA